MVEAPSHAALVADDERGAALGTTWNLRLDWRVIFVHEINAVSLKDRFQRNALSLAHPPLDVNHHQFFGVAGDFKLGCLTRVEPQRRYELANEQMRSVDRD